MMKPVVLHAFACFVLYGAAPASAQSYPSKPIRMIVPFAAGAPDAAARILAQQLQVQMGQPVLVENRPGANGLPGTEAVARADPDGYTLRRLGYRKLLGK